MDGVFSAFSQLSRGFNSYVRGFRWLREHPSYFVLLMLPVAISMLVLVSCWGVLFHYHDQIFALILFAKPEVWWMLAFYYVAKAMLYFVLFVMSLVVYMLLLNVLAIPLYEVVSAAVEKDLTGRVQDETSLWDSFRLMKEELKKVLFIIGVSMVLLFVPGINILSPLVAAFFIGWEFYDLTLARKKWSFKKRLHFVMTHFWSVTGLGLWLILPGGQMFLMPFAVVGASMLAVEDMREFGI